MLAMQQGRGGGEQEFPDLGRKCLLGMNNRVEQPGRPEFAALSLFVVIRIKPDVKVALRQHRVSRMHQGSGKCSTQWW